MKKVEYWEAFDGERFDNEEACLEYEKNHIFFDNSRIRFYSNAGNLIAYPCDSVFLDSNRFKVMDEEALAAYIKYCERWKIGAPTYADREIGYPLHYSFYRGEWLCLEQEIYHINDTIARMYDDTMTEEELEERHNLIEGEH